MFASLVLGTRYRSSWVWAAAAAAFAVHMAIAVTAGQLLALLPRRGVDAAVAALFVAGSAYLRVTSFRRAGREGADASRQGGRPSSPDTCISRGNGSSRRTGHWGHRQPVPRQAGAEV